MSVFYYFYYLQYCYCPYFYCREENKFSKVKKYFPANLIFYVSREKSIYFSFPLFFVVLIVYVYNTCTLYFVYQNLFSREHFCINYFRLLQNLGRQTFAPQSTKKFVHYTYTCDCLIGIVTSTPSYAQTNKRTP